MDLVFPTLVLTVGILALTFDRKVANGVVTRAISESPVACTPLGGLHDCEWADYVVGFVVRLALGATFPLTA